MLFFSTALLPDSTSVDATFYLRAADRPKSAGKRDAVYIVCTIETEKFTLSGTAFAVTEDLIVTCAHSVKAKGRKTSKNCMLFSSVTRCPTGIEYPPYRIPISLVKLDEADDWAVYKRMDDKKFSIFLAVERYLPEPSTNLSFTIYHAPLSVIGLADLNSLTIWGEFTSLLQYDPKLVFDKDAVTGKIEGRYFVSANGKCGGSLGAPIVNKNGRVIAFHTASFNEDLDYDLTQPKLTAKNLKLGSADMTETQSNSQVTSACASYSHATIISTVPDLMTLINAPASNTNIDSTRIEAADSDSKRQTRSSCK